MNLQGIIVYYKIDTGQHDHTDLSSFEGMLNEFVDHLFEVAKKEGTFHKQIFVVDKDARKTIYYKANFK